MENHFLFPTPVFVVTPTDTAIHHEELASRLLKEAESVGTVRRSNVGGWHSLPDFALRPEPCFHGLLSSIVDQVSMVTDGLARQGGRALPPFGFGVQGQSSITAPRTGTLRAGPHELTKHSVCEVTLGARWRRS